jgi:hypothetical protein
MKRTAIALILTAAATVTVAQPAIASPQPPRVLWSSFSSSTVFLEAYSSTGPVVGCLKGTCKTLTQGGQAFENAVFSGHGLRPGDRVKVKLRGGEYGSRTYRIRVRMAQG